jgi:hypothetical protein
MKVYNNEVCTRDWYMQASAFVNKTWCTRRSVQMYAWAVPTHDWVCGHVEHLPLQKIGRSSGDGLVPASVVPLINHVILIK